MLRHPERLGATATAALHGLVLVAILTYEPARTAFMTAAPIMVDWIAAPRQAPVRPEPPKPKPVVKQVPKPVEPPPLIAAPQETPSQSPIVVPVAPSPEPEPEAAAPAPAPVSVTPPIFNANYLDNPVPRYPPLSRRAGEQGRVILRVLVNPAGRADEVEVRTSSGYPRLDDTARDTVKHWKFVPAKRGSEPVAGWVLIPISFKLEG